MSGAGRKHRAKHLVQATIDDKFDVNTEILRIRGARGGNIHEAETAAGMIHLLLLPSKFKRVIWVKRGDLVTVEPFSAADAAEAAEAALKSGSAPPLTDPEEIASNQDPSKADSQGSASLFGLIKGVLSYDEVRELSRKGKLPEEFAPSSRKSSAWGSANPNRRFGEAPEEDSEEDEEDINEEDYEIEEDEDAEAE